MAERIEEPEVAVDQGLEPTSPAAMALALGRSGQANERLDAKAEQFLDKQSRLIDLQTEHLHEQRALILSRLRWGRFSDRMKALLQVMTVLVGLAVVIVLAVMAWQAHEDHGLVVQPFSVPPDLAQRGLTGEVIASRLIDRLAELQTDTISGRPASSYANNWGDDIKVEIPETGVSIGELNRWLRKLLGHETTISGEVYRTPTGIAVVAHAGASPSTLHTGADADLDDLVRQAAEDVYAATQPYRYAMYLGERDPDKGIAALEKLAQTGGATDRKWAYDGLGGILMSKGDFAAALRAESASIAVDPRFWPAWGMRFTALAQMGRDQEALATTQRADELTRRDDSGDVAVSRSVIFAVDAVLAAAIGDFSKAARENTEAIDASGASLSSTRYGLASDDIHLHDLQAARDVEAQLTAAPGAGEPENQEVVAARMTLDAGVASEDENWPALWTVYAGIDPSKLGGAGRGQFATYVAPLAALARAKMGDVAGAQAIIATTPLDCYLCVRIRGQIDAVAHDWAAADRWFSEAVRQGPSLPFADADWGEMLLRKGDAAGAIAKLEQAHKLGPHYADPLELWGEALMATHDYAGAVSKFTEADKDAPRWGRNHLCWGEALMLSGRYAQARAQYQIANGLDLSVGDRAALNVLLARTAKGPLHG